ncbi:MAG: 5-formyltetrahydrofolate cyclo-ligase [Cyanobacteria bacterium P01_E01_bin.6]
MNDKATLRRSLINKRQTMSSDEWRGKSDRLCQYLQHATFFQQATTILAYISFRNEPDLTPLVQRDEHRWGFPRCVGKEMEWHQWSPNGERPLHKGAFGILEPDPQSPKLNPDQVDLILVPSVACDRQGYRLGYGGGFYDRMFSNSIWRRKPTIGIVFSDMLVDALPIDSWDYPLDAICTDHQCMVMNPTSMA